MTDLEAVRQRSQRCDEYRDDPHDTIREWALAAVASAADVPALLTEIERLRSEVFTLTNSEDAMLAVVTVERDELVGEVARLRRERDDARADVREAGKEMRELEADLRAAYSQIEEMP